MRNSILLAFLICFSSLGFSQRNVRDSAIATPWIALHYGLNAPGGDLKDRFGVINHIGAMAGYKTSRNWVYGLDGNFMFGNRVKTSGMFENLIDSKGYIHDANGDVAVVVVNMRGFNANVMVGKVITVLTPNKNSGLYFHAGLGYMQYKIRVETQDQVVPTLELKYRKGYDRYTTGLNFHQFAGYAFMANQGFVNFYAGFYIQEGLTYNRRDVFFDQPDIPVSKAQRLDLQYGFKVGWFVPVYKRKPKDYYFE